MELEIFELEEMGKIKPDMMGYIDKEGRFYSLGKAKRNCFHSFDENSFKDMDFRAMEIAMQCMPEEEWINFLGDLLEYEKKPYRHLPHFWPGDKILKDLGFCLFFRGYFDREEPYEDLSYFEGANLKQLAVLNYLFALNYIENFRIEQKRRDLINLYIEERQKQKDKTIELHPSDK